LDWAHFLDIWFQLNREERAVGLQVGITEAYIVSQKNSQLMDQLVGMCPMKPKKNTTSGDRFLVHQRFYASLVLNELVQGQLLPAVAKHYRINKGHVQSLKQQAATF